MTRLISSAWAAYAVWRGPTISAYLREMISDAGTPCSLDVYDAFFSRRGALAVRIRAFFALFLLLNWEMEFTKRLNDIVDRGPSAEHDKPRLLFIPFLHAASHV
jgi:hypothetical protein